MNDTLNNAAGEFANMIKAAIPEVKINKTGYEIRTQMLELSQGQLWNDYHARWGQFELSINREGDKVLTKVEVPQVPGVDQILETAQKFYDFVNNKR
jgi:hypothetical protein